MKLYFKIGINIFKKDYAIIIKKDTKNQFKCTILLSELIQMIYYHI